MAFFEISTLEDITTLQETIDIECKLAAGRDGRGKLPSDFWETYSSFANCNGGDVFLGLKEKKDSFIVKGLINTKNIIDELFSTLNNSNKVSINLLNDEDVKIIPLEDGNILQIHIPRATREQKPVFINGNPLKGTYKRLNTGDQLCREDEVKRLLAEQVEDSRDSKLISGFDFTDLEFETFSGYRQLFRNTKPDHPWNTLDDKEFLRSIGGWRKNRESGAGNLTLAGLLMFGKLPSIQEALDNYLVDYQERPEAKAEARWVDRITLDGTWSGNLFDFYRKVIAKLTSDLKVPFNLKSNQRKDESIVHIALREALINTIVHADYTERVSVLIVKRPDMFGFRNPGLMRIPFELAVAGGVSDCRNRTIHQMFLLVGLGERAGSGIPKIYSGWKSQNWNRPKLYEKSEPPQTLLELHMVDLVSPEVKNFLQHHFASDYTSFTPDEIFILSLAYLEHFVDHRRLMEFKKFHPKDLSELLNRMEQKRILESSGMGRGKVYFIANLLTTPSGDNDFYTSFLEPLFLTSPGQNNSKIEAGDLSVAAGDLSAATGDLSTATGDLSAATGDLSAATDDLSAATGDFEEWEKLKQIAEPVASKARVKKEEMKNVILEICRGHYVKIQQLSTLLGRDAKVLRRDHVTPLIEQGLLDYAYPATPTHQDQGYMTSEKKTPSSE